MDVFDDYEWEFAAPPNEAMERFQRFQLVYESESMRGRMLVTMGFVEGVLAGAIGNYLIDTDPAVLRTFAVRSLGSLSAKLNLGYLLGIIDQREFSMIEKMAKIRNDFAHEPLASEGDPTLRNHVRDLATLQGIDQYKESESDDYVNEVWTMTIWSLLTALVNRPARVEQRRLRFRDWEISAP